MLSCLCCVHPQIPGYMHDPNYSSMPKCKIPMTSLSFSAKIDNSIVNLSITQEFQNPGPKPIEIQYSFHLSEDSVITSLKIHLQDGTTLIAKVKDSETASEDHQDAISSGNTAVLGSVEDDNQQINLNIGNLAPSETIKVEFGLSFPLLADGNKWKLKFPKEFFPVDCENVEFSAEVILDSSKPIVEYLSNFDVEWNLSQDRLNLEGRSKIKRLEGLKGKKLWVKYCAEDSNLPTLIYQEVLWSFVFCTLY